MFSRKQGVLQDKERLGELRVQPWLKEKQHLFKLWKGHKKCKKGCRCR